MENQLTRLLYTMANYIYIYLYLYHRLIDGSTAALPRPGGASPSPRTAALPRVLSCWDRRGDGGRPPGPLRHGDVPSKQWGSVNINGSSMINIWIIYG